MQELVNVTTAMTMLGYKPNTAGSAKTIQSRFGILPTATVNGKNLYSVEDIAQALKTHPPIGYKVGADRIKNMGGNRVQIERFTSTDRAAIETILTLVCALLHEFGITPDKVRSGFAEFDRLTQEAIRRDEDRSAGTESGAA